jgi:hypothetical protein
MLRGAFLHHLRIEKATHLQPIGGFGNQSFFGAQDAIVSHGSPVLNWLIPTARLRGRAESIGLAFGYATRHDRKTVERI